ncbi:PA2779 family protein [Caenimonas koreensis DSM 17982]|uniref:PA2779 family protein n=3 Tax=Caenimonas TaxID=763439 RepID=A0A844B996_9BURK|nr:PA2779 family protein [Caenimonas koreensis DSM 17982]
MLRLAAALRYAQPTPRSLKMSSMKKMTCRALVVSLLALSFQTANAGMIGADQAAAQTDRAMVLSVLSRAETASQLQAQGIDPAAARARVAAMTDQEVQALAQDMQTAPAGAMSSGGWWAVVIVAALIWYFAYRK